MKRRLIALMAAGVITTASLTGCATQSVDDSWVGGPTLKEGYIIIEQNDNDVLHQGNLYESAHGSTNSFKFSCGEEFRTNAVFSGYYKEPEAERYDEKCEECFGAEQ